jgi:uncharacterized protein YndB with AHSA1/START domain
MDERETFGFDLAHQMNATAAAIYRAWTQDFDTWFATPGTLRMRPAAGEPFYFDVAHEGTHHPHYGRFITLEADRRVELTWVTGAGGTEGAETTLGIELTPTDTGTRLVLNHDGFYTRTAADATQQAWPHILDHLDEVLTAGAR